jgi:hypothetical protein
LTGSENWEGNRGTLLEIDHFNPATNKKETRVRVCHDISLQGERICGTVLHQVCSLLIHEKDINITNSFLKFAEWDELFKRW